MIGPEIGTLVFCQPCSGRQSVRIWQQYNLLKGSPDLILMIGSFLIATVAKCRRIKRPTCDVLSDDLMSATDNYCPETEQYFIRWARVSGQSGHQPRGVTSGVRTDNTALNTLSPRLYWSSKTGSGNTGRWGRCSQGQGGGTITNMRRIFAFYWVVCERKREIFYHNYTPHTCIHGVSVYFLFSW